MSFAKQPPQPIQFIRLALILGVLMFGGVILFVRGQPSWSPRALPAAVGYALEAYAVVAVVIATAMRGRVSAAADPQRRASLLLTGWAFGEGAALFGGAMFLLTGQAQWYLIGLVALACSFVVLPIRGGFGPS